MVYSSDYSLNVEIQVKIIEEIVGRGLFIFVFGKEDLLNAKTKARNVDLLQQAGLVEGKFLVIGTELDGFNGLESSIIPISWHKSAEVH